MGYVWELGDEGVTQELRATTAKCPPSGCDCGQSISWSPREKEEILSCVTSRASVSLPCLLISTVSVKWSSGNSVFSFIVNLWRQVIGRKGCHNFYVDFISCFLCSSYRSCVTYTSPGLLHFSSNLLFRSSGSGSTRYAAHRGQCQRICVWGWSLRV